LATVALRRRDQVYARARQLATRNLQLLDDFFSEEPDVFGWVRPRGGFTAFPWLKLETDARPFCRALLADGISIAPGDCFGMPAHVRIGFGGSGEQFPAAMERIRRKNPAFHRPIFREAQSSSLEAQRHTRPAPATLPRAAERPVPFACYPR
jgi:aspartate/methionine/tyrosine aminotransferase